MDNAPIDSSADIASFLVSDDARSIVSAAIESLGWALIDYTTDKPYIRPGAGVSVGYFVSARATDRDFTTYLTASTEKVDNSAAVLTFNDPEGIIPVPIYVWQFPNDPALPALAQATNVAAMTQLWPQRKELEASVVVYRPTRRAVIEYKSEGVSFGFGKVVHPEKAAELVRRTHAVAQGEAPVPAILYASDAGLVVSETATGQPLSNLIAFDADAAIDCISALEASLDALPDDVLSLDRHPSWTDRVHSYARSSKELLPESAADIDAVVEWISDVVADADALPDVASHGDFFEANILVDDAGTLTFIDLDHVGPGKRNDDWGCLLAHVSVLPFLTEDQWVSAAPDEPFRDRLEQLNPGGMRCSFYPRSEEVLERWCEYLEQRTDARDLYARAAAVTLSMVSNADVNGALREARARMRRAVWWMERGQDYVSR